MLVAQPFSGMASKTDTLIVLTLRTEATGLVVDGRPYWGIALRS
jgi:hypothetical protein